MKYPILGFDDPEKLLRKCIDWMECTTQEMVDEANRALDDLMEIKNNRTDIPLWLEQEPDKSWDINGSMVANCNSLRFIWDKRIYFIGPLKKNGIVIPDHFLSYKYRSEDELFDDLEVDIKILKRDQIPNNAIKIGSAFCSYLALRNSLLNLRFGKYMLCGENEEKSLLREMSTFWELLSSDEQSIILNKFPKE